MLDQKLAQALLLHLVDVRVDAVDDPNLCSRSAAVFGPTGNAGDVVGRVARQREQIAQLPAGRRTSLDLGRAVGLVAHRVPDHDAVVVERAASGPCRAPTMTTQSPAATARSADGGDEIVGLDAVALKDRDA